MPIIKIIILILLISLADNSYAIEAKTYLSDGKIETKVNDPELNRDLVYRVAFGKADSVKKILDKGADPEAKNIGGVSVLQIAVLRKDEDAPAIVQYLLDAGANVNAMNKNRHVAVLDAVKNGRPDVLQILIDHRAVLGEVRDEEGYDLLTVAESRANLDIVKILNAGLEREKDKVQGLKSEDNFIKLLQEYSYLSCANEYLNFYISGNPKNVNMVAFNKIVTGNSEEIIKTGGQLKMLFKMKEAELKLVQGRSRGQIISQMHYYETNENRELNGIGTDRDLNERCWKIAQKWNASRLNMEQYRQNTK